MILQADGDPSQPVSIFDDVPRQCPGVELRWIENASHFSNLDQPEAVARAINEFVDRDR
jgi:pimeloyl-ACP methyl ester carboxylesterase